MKKITYFLSIILLVSCAGMPGSVSVDKDKYSGNKIITLAPGWANTDGSVVKIGARKSKTTGDGKSILIVRNDQIRNFSSQTPNLAIKIDGKESKFSPLSKKTECSVSSSSDTAHCYQEYLIDDKLFEKMVSAKEVLFKISLRDNKYTIGSLENSGPSTARTVIEDFVKKIKEEF